MKLFIIGNGFDLDHKMKTKYIDFKKFIMNNYMFNNMDNELSIYYAAQVICKLIDEVACDENWSNLEESLGKIDYLSLLDLNMNLDDDDINDQIANNILNIENLLHCFLYFDELLDNWINKCNKCKIKPKRKYIDVFTNDSLYLTFNYTNVLEKIYNINDKNILHIHGSFDTKKVLGHANKDPNIGIRALGCEDLIKKIHRGLKKPIHKIIYDNREFFNRIKNVDEIYIIGWSISNVDIEYLQVIKKALNGRRIKLHFTKYDKEQKKKNSKVYLHKISKFKGVNYTLEKYI